MEKTVLSRTPSVGSPTLPILTWTNPTRRVDGSPFQDTDAAGYEIQIDDLPAISLPVQTAGTSFDLSTLAIYDDVLRFGTHRIMLRVVSKEGTRSALSGPVTLSTVSKPAPPTNLEIV